MFMLHGGGFPDLYGFHSSPLPEPFCSSMDCDTFPVDAVAGCLNMNCNAIPGVFSPHCLSVFTEPNLRIVSSWFLPHKHLGNPYRESHTPLLFASVLGSLSLLPLFKISKSQEGYLTMKLKSKCF